MTARIVKTPDVCFGKPRIDGTRIWTRLIQHLVDAGHTVASINDLYPHLTPAQIEAALAYEAAPHRRVRRWLHRVTPIVTIVVEMPGGRLWEGRWD